MLRCSHIEVFVAVSLLPCLLEAPCADSNVDSGVISMRLSCLHVLAGCVVSVGWSMPMSMPMSHSCQHGVSTSQHFSFTGDKKTSEENTVLPKSRKMDERMRKRCEAYPCLRAPSYPSSPLQVPVPEHLQTDREGPEDRPLYALDTECAVLP